MSRSGTNRSDTSRTEDGLREAFASVSREAAEDGHLDADQLWALAAGTMASGAARPLIDHISRCPACAEDLRVTRGLAAETAAGESESPEARERNSLERKPFETGWFRGLAAAAAILLAVGLGWRFSQPEDQPFRQGEEEQIRSLLPTGEALPRDAVTLRWAGPADAAYDLVVTTEDLSVIVDVKGLSVTEFQLSPADLSELPAGSRLFWQIEAVLPDGSRRASPSFDLQLADE